MDRFDVGFFSVDVVRAGGDSASTFGSLIAVDDASNCVGLLTMILRLILASTTTLIIIVAGSGRQFNFNLGNLFVVFDKGSGIVRTAEERGLASETEADGTEYRGFSCSVWSTDYIEAVFCYIALGHCL